MLAACYTVEMTIELQLVFPMLMRGVGRKAVVLLAVLAIAHFRLIFYFDRCICPGEMSLHTLPGFHIWKVAYKRLSLVFWRIGIMKRYFYGHVCPFPSFIRGNSKILVMFAYIASSAGNCTPQ